MKVRDCEQDGYSLWGDQLLLDWLREEQDSNLRDGVVSWVLALVDAPMRVEGFPVPGGNVDAVCAFVAGTDVAVTWIVDGNRCIVWIIEIEALGDLGG
ncbi:MAG: hypothetical protein WD770_02365 [Actinomycetota bacterium]